jgi:Ssl1-like
MLFDSRIYSEIFVGNFAVSLNEDHLNDLFMACVVPSPLNTNKTSWKLIQMGFPTLILDAEAPSLCAW